MQFQSMVHHDDLLNNMYTSLCHFDNVSTIDSMLVTFGLTLGMASIDVHSSKPSSRQLLAGLAVVSLIYGLLPRCRSAATLENNASLGQAAKQIARSSDGRYKG